jgi:hypothetical protein
MPIQFRVPDLLDLVSDYVKPLNPHFAELDAGFQKWVEAASFLSASQKKVCIQLSSTEYADLGPGLETCGVAFADGACLP